MAYTPVNWQTGDTITAERLNRMDRGWDVETTELFSETVTTAEQSGMYMATLAYSGTIDADSITVTFDGTEYICSRIDASFGRYYGGFSQSGPDFTNYPFAIESITSANNVYTETETEHTVAVSVSSSQTSADFAAAVHPIADEAIASAIASVPTPLLVTVRTTTWAEVNSALKAGRSALVWNHTTQRNQPDTYEFVVMATYTTWKVYTLTYDTNTSSVVVKTYQADSQTGALDLVTS